MSKQQKTVRVVTREELQETPSPKRNPRAINPRELNYRPFEQALRHVIIKEAK